MTSSESEQQSTSTQDSGQQLRREATELVKMVFLFLILFLTLRTFVIEGYEVRGDSMLPNLEDGDRILVFKFTHRLAKWSIFSGMEPITAGDVVVFDSLEDGNKRYIKRVIAKGPQAGAPNTVAAGSEEQAKGPVVEYTRGKVYVENSLITEDYILEESYNSFTHDKRVLREGEFYVLGDHRSVSKDSRSFGPVKSNQIIGQALLRFWPLSKFGLL